MLVCGCLVHTVYRQGNVGKWCACGKCCKECRKRKKDRLRQATRAVKKKAPLSSAVEIQAPASAASPSLVSSTSPKTNYPLQKLQRGNDLSSYLTLIVPAHVDAHQDAPRSINFVASVASVATGPLKGATRKRKNKPRKMMIMMMIMMMMR